MTKIAAHTSAAPEDQNLMLQHGGGLVGNGYQIIAIIPRREPGRLSQNAEASISGRRARSCDPIRTRKSAGKRRYCHSG
jgi:hypothetical protein